MSKTVQIRLSADEFNALEKIVATNETVGFENRSEFFRLLLQRERTRRGDKIEAYSYQTAGRFGGRPKINFPRIPESKGAVPSKPRRLQST